MSRLALAALLGLAGIAAFAVFVTARQPAGGEAVDTAFVEPARVSPAPSAAPAVPPVPVAADSLEPLTFSLATTWTGTQGGPRTIEQRVTRSRERVHLVVDEGRREWYFERNSVYRDRVSGALVDHDAKEIREYEDADLRNMLRIRGWSDALTMRFDIGVLNTLTHSGERRRIEGHDAQLHIAAPGTTAGVMAVWWSPELLLPLELVTRESPTITVKARVMGLSPDVDATVLESPHRRFPTYRVLDEVDAGEHR
jgi:hypothetical protein